MVESLRIAICCMSTTRWRDNDRVVADLMRPLETSVGEESARQYWAIFEGLRSELGYADYLGRAAEYLAECPYDLNVLKFVVISINYPFANRLFL